MAGWGVDQPALFARRRLILSLHRALAEERDPIAAAPLVSALGRALQELRGRGLDPLAADWADEVERIVRRARGRLADELRRDWPPPPETRVVDLARRERPLVPGG